MTTCAHARYDPVESIAGATIGWRCATCGRVFRPFACRVCGEYAGTPATAAVLAAQHGRLCEVCRLGRVCPERACANCARLDELRVGDRDCERCRVVGPHRSRRGEVRHAQIRCVECGAWTCPQPAPHEHAVKESA